MSDRGRCVRCQQGIQPGDYYVECRQAVKDEDGKTVIVVGVMTALAHLDCKKVW